MKYISMKMEPKGSRPPMAAMTGGRRYQARPGTGLGMRFTRHGLSGTPFQLRPTTCARARAWRHSLLGAFAPAGVTWGVGVSVSHSVCFTF